MGLVLGGVAFGVGPERLKWPLILTAASGLLLLAAAVHARCLVLSEGAGWGLFLKLALLGLGNAIPAVRIELFIAATLVASVASHLPSAWRHRAPPWR